MRFDEVELEAVPLMLEEEPAAPLPVPPPRGEDAALWRRLLALFTDLSVFAAMALALSPFLPQPFAWLPSASLAGFVIVFSYYYFVGTWILWGKTIGGAIFDVRVTDESRTLRGASLRWSLILLSVSAGALVAALLLR